MKFAEVFGLEEKYSCVECGADALWYDHPCVPGCPDGPHSHTAWCDDHVPRDCEGCNTAHNEEDRPRVAPREEWEPCVEIVRLDSDMEQIAKF